MSKSIEGKSSNGLGAGIKQRLFELDRILRGDATRIESLVKTESGETEFKIPVVGVSVTVICLAVIYGFCMGTFALVRGAENAEYAQACLQTFASMCKVPLLFVMTLVVTFPSLYVFNALVGSRLKMGAVLKLLVASLAVNLAVLASLGPILAFFSVSTPNYGFIVLLNVIVFSIAGVLGLAFLIQTMSRLVAAYNDREKLRYLESQRESQTQVQRESQQRDTDGDEPSTELTEAEPIAYAQTTPQTSAQRANLPPQHRKRTGPLAPTTGVVLGRHIWKVFGCWIIVFSLVGAQMGWILRPFIGAPNTPFTWFRARSSNFFEAVINVIQNLLF